MLFLSNTVNIGDRGHFHQIGGIGLAKIAEPFLIVLYFKIYFQLFEVANFLPIVVPFNDKAVNDCEEFGGFHDSGALLKLSN